MTSQFQRLRLDPDEIWRDSKVKSHIWRLPKIQPPFKNKSSSKGTQNICVIVFGIQSFFKSHFLWYPGTILRSQQKTMPNVARQNQAEPEIAGMNNRASESSEVFGTEIRHLEKRATLVRNTAGGCYPLTMSRYRGHARIHASLDPHPGQAFGCGTSTPAQEWLMIRTMMLCLTPEQSESLNIMFCSYLPTHTRYVYIYMAT